MFRMGFCGTKRAIIVGVCEGFDSASSASSATSASHSRTRVYRFGKALRCSLRLESRNGLADGNGGGQRFVVELLGFSVCPNCLSTFFFRENTQ